MATWANLFRPNVAICCPEKPHFKILVRFMRLPRGMLIRAPMKIE